MQSTRRTQVTPFLTASLIFIATAVYNVTRKRPNDRSHVTYFVTQKASFPWHSSFAKEWQQRSMGRGDTKTLSDYRRVFANQISFRNNFTSCLSINTVNQFRQIVKWQPFTSFCMVCCYGRSCRNVTIIAVNAMSSHFLCVQNKRRFTRKVRKFWLRMYVTANFLNAGNELIPCSRR